MPRRTGGIVFQPVEKRILLANGISRQLISAWESGRARPGKTMAAKVHGLIGYPILDLLYGPDHALPRAAGISLGK